MAPLVCHAYMLEFSAVALKLFICLFLSVGCGSGLSGETLSENGHQWIGLDISEAMLGILKKTSPFFSPLLILSIIAAPTVI